jgi:hypothetical protein
VFYIYHTIAALGVHSIFFCPKLPLVCIHISLLVIFYTWYNSMHFEHLVIKILKIFLNYIWYSCCKTPFKIRELNLALCRWSNHFHFPFSDVAFLGCHHLRESENGSTKRHEAKFSSRILNGVLQQFYQIYF